MVLGAVCQLVGQSPEALSGFFESKQVIVKLDMPGTQQGVDIYPQRTQALDLKSYSNRMKKFGTALRNGDSVMVTKIKVKDNNIEFQLAGGGYGTISDDTDTSVQFTPSDKSGREKDLEDQLKSETDQAKRRSLQRQLDDARAARERRDQRDRMAAEDAAESKKQRIGTNRQQGGSRFNIRFEPRRPVTEMTPQTIMSALTAYVTFPPDTFGSSDSSRPTEAGANSTPEPSTSQPNAADPVKGLKKGLTLEQVKALFGQPTDTHDRLQGGLKVTTCTFQNKDVTVQGDFVNGVLVQYTLSSR
ncbi:MAG: hypothetical protein JOY85_12100 [Acidobacteriaceae bacterium]|nr:hypothetical protein [Acidobacteriaceae bacterium]